MNGIAAVRQLLVGDSTLTALVPATRIVEGDLPQGTPLPLISIGEVSEVDMQTTVVGGKVFVVERIDVAAGAGNYPALVPIMKAIKSAAHGQSPEVAGIANVEVRADGKGPTFRNEAASVYSRSQSFRVSYTQTL